MHGFIIAVKDQDVAMKDLDGYCIAPVIRQVILPHSNHEAIRNVNDL
jgi:hypothetical protein